MVEGKSGWRHTSTSRMITFKIHKILQMSFVESCREGKPSRNNSRKCFSWGYFSWPDWHTQTAATHPGWLFHVFASPAWARDEEMWLISDIMNTKCNDKPNGEPSKKDVVIIVFIRAPHNCQAQVQVLDKIQRYLRINVSQIPGNLKQFNWCHNISTCHYKQSKLLKSFKVLNLNCLRISKQPEILCKFSIPHSLSLTLKQILLILTQVLCPDKKFSLAQAQIQNVYLWVDSVTVLPQQRRRQQPKT